MPHDLQFIPFPVYVSGPRLMRFVTRYELFRRILHVPGDIVVCGIYEGYDLFSFVKLHAEMEPRNRYRKIAGFDTFSGYTEFGEYDKELPESDRDIVPGGCCADWDKFERNLRATSKQLGAVMPQVEIGIGDVAVEGPKYLADHPDTIVSLLYLDMNIYEPTKAALECFVPLMPHGAVLALDNLCAVHWPGATVAAKEVLGVRRWRRFEWENNLAWCVM